MNETLYIIGNGFDLHHGLRTSYMDFRDDNVCKNKWLWDMLRFLYGNRIEMDLWWSDIEVMLGQVNYTHILESNNGMVLGPSKVRNLLEHNLQIFFGKWLSSISRRHKTSRQPHIFLFLFLKQNQSCIVFYKSKQGADRLPFFHDFVQLVVELFEKSGKLVPFIFRLWNQVLICQFQRILYAHQCRFPGIRTPG